MTSRRERVLAHLADVVVHEGTIAELAADMNDSSANSVSATVSVLIKQGLVKRAPNTPGALARWLWLIENDESAQRVIADAGVSDEVAESEQPPVPDVDEGTLDPAFGTIDDDGHRHCPDGVVCLAECTVECQRVIDGHDPIGADRWPQRVLDAHITASLPAEPARVNGLRSVLTVEDVLAAPTSPPRLHVTLDVSQRLVYVEKLPLTEPQVRRLIDDLESALRAREAL